MQLSRTWLMKMIVSFLQKKAVSSSGQQVYLFLNQELKESESLTYGELDKKARRIAGYLQSKDKNIVGKRILLLYRETADFISAFFGCLYAGAIAVPQHCPKIADIDSAFSLINAVINDADVIGILTEKNLFEFTQKFSENRNIKIFFVDSALIKDRYIEQYTIPHLHANDIAYLQYTSGSTSLPKAAVVSHKNLSHSLEATVKGFHYFNNAVTLNWAPHTHVYGLVCGLLTPLYHGSLAIIMKTESFVTRPVSWLEAISQYHVTHSGCPNFGYDLCIREITTNDLRDIRLDNWKVAVNGGESVQYDTLIKFTEKFSVCGFNLKHFCPAYGMSELTGAISTNRFCKKPIFCHISSAELKKNKVAIVNKNQLHRTVVSCGELVSGLHAVVIDPDTLLPVETGKIGEIWLAGPSLVKGYWRREEETHQVFYAKIPHSPYDFFRTGDLGFIKDKNIFLTGRLKDILVIYGEKYYPLDLENKIGEAIEKLSVKNRGVAISCLIEDKDQIIYLQEVNGDADSELQIKLMDSIHHTLLQYFGLDAHSVALIKEKSIPTTSSGKIQRKRCQQNYLENKIEIINQKIYAKSHFQSPHILHPNNVNLNVNQVIDIIASVLHLTPKQIDLDAPISDYGFDSISLVKLSQLLNDKCGLKITPADFFAYNTLQDFFNKSVKKVDIKKPPNPSEPTIHQENEMDSKDIAIIGIDCLFPGATNPEEFWNNLDKNICSIREIPKERWIVKNDKAKWAGLIDDVALFDAKFFNMSPREAELTDPQQRLFLQVAWNAIEDAGYSKNRLANIKTGVFVGVFNSDYSELLEKNNIIDAYFSTGVSESTIANRVSYFFDFHGPSEVVNTACSSSLVAIHDAILALHNNDCEIALVGGVNLLLSPTFYLSAEKAGMLSEDGKCKTFDKKANGYVRGEGVAAILLKPLEKALLDHDPIYGIIKGSAVNHGGYVNSITVPNPNAQAELIISACERAKVDIETITYIETHGTGTPLGDPIEINGLKQAFHDLQERQGKLNISSHYCGIGSVKTNIGHLEAVAGIAGVIKVLLAMKHGRLPGNLFFEELNPYIELTDTPFYIVDKTVDWKRLTAKNHFMTPRRAGVSSFGFGGTNAHIILEEYIREKEIKEIEEIEEQPYLITLSAKTENALYQRIKDLLNWLPKNQHIALSEISYTLNSGRNHFIKRCAFVVNSVLELQDTLRQMLKESLGDNFIVSLDNNKDKIAPIFREVFETLLNDIDSQTLLIEKRKSKLLALGNFYVQGYALDWDLIQSGKKTRISMPTYPFEGQHYWLPRIEQHHDIDDLTKEISNNTVDNMSLSERVQKDFIKFITDILKIHPDNIVLSDSLSEMGLDSIAFKELATQLEKHYAIQLTPSVFFSHNTIQELSQYFLENYSASIEKIYGVNELQREKPNRLSKKENKKNLDQSSLSVNEPIAIIGMQGYFPQSENLTEFWEHLIHQHDLVTEIPDERWDWRKYYSAEKISSLQTNSKWGSFIKNIDKFDAAFFNISSREANFMDPQHRLFMEVVWKTIEDAGYDPFQLSAQHTVGLFAGMEFNEYQTILQAQEKLLQGYVFTGNSHAMLANRISYFVNFHGPCEVIDTTCSSSLVAVHRAVTALRARECNMAIAGGVSLILSPETFVITSQLNVLSPDGRCKTFDKSANGYVKGEGVAAIVLKPLENAIRDKDYIYGVIKGSAEVHGGKSQSLTAPNVPSQVQLLNKAYDNAAISPETVTYIEVHGTGTELGDPIEVDALKQFFSARQSSALNKAKYCGLGSVKTNIGHLEPASGIAGLIKVLLSLKHKVIPANLHFTELNPYIELEDSPFYVINKTQPWDRLKDNNGNEIPRRAGVSSFGVGGTNVHLLIEEAPKISIQSDNQPNPHYLITLSAKNDEALLSKVIELRKWLEINNNVTDLKTLSYTLNIGRTDFQVRCALVVESIKELTESLRILEDKKQPKNCLTRTVQTNHFPDPSLIQKYQFVINSLDAAKNQPDVYLEKLMSIAEMYTNNYSIDWEFQYDEEKIQRMGSLPTYPFIKKRYWFDEELKIVNQKSIPTQQTHSISVQDTSRDSTVNANQFLLNYLKQIFSEILRITPEEISINQTYEMYGIDSMLGLEIINRLEKDFGELYKTLLYERNTLQDLATYFLENFSEVIQQLNPNNPHQQSTNKTSDQPIFQDSSPISLTQHAQDDIAIIGLHFTFPLANDVDEFWQNLSSGRDCITEIPKERWNYQDYPIDVGGKQKFYNQGGFIADIDKFDPLFFNISPFDAAIMDPQERLFLQTAWATIEDAGYTRDSLQSKAKNKVGVFVGVTYNFYPLYIADEWQKGNKLPLDIQLFPVANRVSYFLNLQGPSFIVDTACSSSLTAIHLACESLARGECIMALAGGVNLSLHPNKYHMLGAYSFLSDQGRCVSFGEGGTGYVPGEGVGAVLLKPLSLALRDNDRIYGVIKGSSTNHGGKTSGFSVPSPKAQSELIKNVLEKTGINPRTITYIEAHGTGTALGDPIEIRGLQDAFSGYTTDKQFCAIGSVKSNIGHLESAAGISQLVKVLLQFKYKKIVPSLHAKKLNPYIDFAKTPFFVPQETFDWKKVDAYPLRAGISSFGAGGTNVHIIVENYETPSQMSEFNNDPYIYLISALTTDRLEEYVKKTYSYFFQKKEQLASVDAEKLWLRNACYTSQIGRESMSMRMAILASSFDDMLEKLHGYINNPENTIENVYTNKSPITQRKENSEVLFFLQKKQFTHLITLWVDGVIIPWEKLYENQKLQKVFIPTYPFAKRRCWVTEKKEEVKPNSILNTQINNDIEFNIDIKNWLYCSTWIEQQKKLNTISNHSGYWIIFGENELSVMLENRLLKNTYSVVLDKDKDKDQATQNHENRFYINPYSFDDYNTVIKDLLSNKKDKLKGIIYLWGISDIVNSDSHDLLAESHKLQTNEKLFYLLKILACENIHKIRFLLVTRSTQSITGSEVVEIWQKPLWTLARIFSAEQGNYQVSLLDLDDKKDVDSEVSYIIDAMFDENGEESAVAYRNHTRFVNRLASYLPEHKQLLVTHSWVSPNAVIITGGLGALGFEVAKFLIQKGAKYVLLTGSTLLPDPSEWPSVQEAALQEKIHNLLSLEKSGCVVKYVTASIVDYTQMQQVIHQVESEWKHPIKGVFHLAGLTTDGITIDKLTPDIIKKILSVKMQGCLVLHELFKNSTLDCFVLFSSIASFPNFGISGLSAYAVANAFLDGFAEWRGRQGLPAIAINWAAWAEKGMSFRYNHNAFLDAVGMSVISIKNGIEIFHYLLTQQNHIQNIAIFKIDWNKFFKVNSEARKLPFFRNFTITLPQNTDLTKAKQFSEEEITSILVTELANTLKLGTHEINVDVAYQQYGMDSIIGINFVGKLAEYFSDKVSPMDLYRYPTLKKLANYIFDKQQIEKPDVITKVSMDTSIPDISHLTNDQVSQMIEDEIKELNKSDYFSNNK